MATTWRYLKEALIGVTEWLVTSGKTDITGTFGAFTRKNLFLSKNCVTVRVVSKISSNIPFFLKADNFPSIHCKDRS